LRHRTKNGTPAAITTSPTDDRTGRSIHKLIVKATAANKKISGVHG
jgi:hypothetical protein